MGKMLVKGIICICIQAVFYKAVFGQCIAPSSIPREPLCNGNIPVFDGQNVAGLTPVTPLCSRVIGSNLMIDTSAPYTPIGPAGVSIFSDNLLIEGTVLVTGKVPFVGTVGLEGVVPTTGTSTVSYGCGTAAIGIVNDGIPGTVTDVLLPVDCVGLTGSSAGCNVVGIGAR